MVTRKEKALEFVDEGYRVHVTGRHMEVTEAMKNYAIEKITRITRFSDRIIDLWITMDIQKLQHRIDVILKVDHIKITAEGISDNMYASIDQVVAKLKRQISRYRERIRDHQARGIKMEEMMVNVIERPIEDVEFINDEIEDETQKAIENNFEYNQIKEEKRPLKVLRRDEAIMKLDLSGDVFLIYRAEEDQKLHVVYRRNDGHFGLIHIES